MNQTFLLCVAVFVAVSLWNAVAVEGKVEYAAGLSWLKSQGADDGSMGKTPDLSAFGAAVLALSSSGEDVTEALKAMTALWA